MTPLKGRGKKNWKSGQADRLGWPPPKRSGKCENFWLLTLVYDYIWLVTNFTPQFFLTTYPPLPPLPAGTRNKFGICQNFLTWPYKTTLKMHFSASSQWSKICFGYQGIIFNGKKGLTFSQIVLVRLEGGDPPPPKRSAWPLFHSFFFTPSLIQQGGFFL